MMNTVQLRKVNPMPETFADFVERERERINGELERLRLDRSKIGDAMFLLEKELGAIAAYETAKTGRPAAAQGRTVRARKGSRREELVALIGGAAGGLSRGDILDKMGLKGNKSGEMSISNALTALTKGGTVVRADGRYRVA